MQTLPPDHSSASCESGAPTAVHTAPRLPHVRTLFHRPHRVRGHASCQPPHSSAEQGPTIFFEGGNLTALWLIVRSFAVHPMAQTETITASSTRRKGIGCGQRATGGAQPLPPPPPLPPHSPRGPKCWWGSHGLQLPPPPMQLAFITHNLLSLCCRFVAVCLLE